MAYGRTVPYFENADWSFNVLEVLLAGIIKQNIEFIAELPVGIIGNTNAARLRNGFEMLWGGGEENCIHRR